MEALQLDVYRKEYEMILEGYTLDVSISRHAIRRGIQRGIYEASILSSIEDSFDYFFGLDNERFIIINHLLGISVIGYIKQDYGAFDIGIVSVIDGTAPTNPHNTVEIEVGR